MSESEIKNDLHICLNISSYGAFFDTFALHVFQICGFVLLIYNFLQAKEDILSNCQDISMSVEYKLSTSVDFMQHYITGSETTYVIVPTEAGEYEIRIVVRNNAGFTSSSDIKTVTVAGK
jgi:hypothetical protein